MYITLCYISLILLVKSKKQILLILRVREEGGKLWKGMNTLGKNNIGHLKVFLPPCVSAAPCAVLDIHKFQHLNE